MATNQFRRQGITFSYQIFRHKLIVHTALKHEPKSLLYYLQVFYQAIATVEEFDDGPVQLANPINVVGMGNAQSYIVLFGIFNNQTEPPVLKALNIHMLASESRITMCTKIVIILASIITIYVA